MHYPIIISKVERMVLRARVGPHTTYLRGNVEQGDLMVLIKIYSCKVNMILVHDLRMDMLV